MWSRNLGWWAVVSPSPCEAGGGCNTTGTYQLIHQHSSEERVENEFFSPFRTEKLCDLGWDKGQSCGVWQDKANSSFLSCCFISHAFCATLSLFFSPYDFHETLEGQGPLHIQQERISFLPSPEVMQEFLQVLWGCGRSDCGSSWHERLPGF